MRILHLMNFRLKIEVYGNSLPLTICFRVHAILTSIESQGRIHIMKKSYTLSCLLAAVILVAAPGMMKSAWAQNNSCPSSVNVGMSFRNGPDGGTSQNLTNVSVQRQSSGCVVKTQGRTLRGLRTGQSNCSGTTTLGAVIPNTSINGFTVPARASGPDGSGRCTYTILNDVFNGSFFTRSTTNNNNNNNNNNNAGKLSNSQVQQKYQSCRNYCSSKASDKAGCYRYCDRGNNTCKAQRTKSACSY